MRFLVLSQYFSPEIGATQTRLSAMTHELRQAGHDVRVVTSLPNYPTGRIFPGYRGRVALKERIEGVEVHRTWVVPAMGSGAGRMLNYGSFALTSLLGLIGAQRPDVVFVESPPLSVAVPGAWAAGVWKTCLVVNVADLWPDSIHELGILREGAILSAARRLESWTYRKADFVTAVTQGIRDSLLTEKGVPPGKVLFLPNGVDTNLFHVQTRDPEALKGAGVPLKQGDRVVMYAGTLGVAQGLEVALDAMRRLASSAPHVRLVFVGDGSERLHLQAKARARGLTNTFFVAAQPPEQLARLWAGADIGFASLLDRPIFAGARPSKLFPMMASGKPVVYAGSGEAPRIIREADAGIVVPPEDSAELAQALALLASDEDLAGRLGTNGRRYVEQNLTWHTLVGDWLDQLLQAGVGVR
jgi:colanic acid biosynthesis glycosyl transferase WcaI